MRVAHDILCALQKIIIAEISIYPIYPTTIVPMAIKPGRIVNYFDGLLPITLNDPLIT